MIQSNLELQHFIDIEKLHFGLSKQYWSQFFRNCIVQKYVFLIANVVELCILKITNNVFFKNIFFIEIANDSLCEQRLFEIRQENLRRQIQMYVNFKSPLPK